MMRGAFCFLLPADYQQFAGQSLTGSAGIFICVMRARGRKAVEDRARVLRRDGGLCQCCKAQGRLRMASEVDHIVALVNGGSDTDDNKRSLCRQCHLIKTRADMGHKPSAACDANGIMLDPRHHWNR